MTRGTLPHMNKVLIDKIQARLTELGLSYRAASLKGGLHEDAVRNIIRGKSRSPRGDTLQGLAKALDWPIEELLNVVDARRQDEAKEEPEEAPGAITWARLASKDGHPSTTAGSIPVYSTKEIQGGALLLMGYAVENTAPSEPVSAVEGAYAIYAPNDLLAPRCDQGDLLHIHPHRPARPGKLVLVRFKPDREGTTRALLRELVSTGLGTITVRTLNPDKKERIPREQIAAVHLVVGVISP